MKLLLAIPTFLNRGKIVLKNVEADDAKAFQLFGESLLLRIKMKGKHLTQLKFNFVKKKLIYFTSVPYKMKVELLISKDLFNYKLNFSTNSSL